MPFLSASVSDTPCFAAKSRTSCVIFIEQKCGPHMEQKCASLAPCCGNVGMSVSGVIEDGMATMSAKFKEMGGQVYLDAEKVKESNKVL